MSFHQMLVPSFLLTIITACGGGDRNKPLPDAAALLGCENGEPFTITERAGVDRRDGLVEAGVPLAKGMVTSADRLMICDGDQAIAASFSATSFWDDGSVRWAALRLPVSVDANATKTLVVAQNDGPSGTHFQPATPNLPTFVLHLKTDQGTYDVPIVNGTDLTTGNHQVRLDVETLTDHRIRIRTFVAQLNEKDRWHNLWLDVAVSGTADVQANLGAIQVGNLTAVVRHAEERGPVKFSYQDGILRIDLYSGSLSPYPADPGFHVSHEVILARDVNPETLARGVALPLRISWDPNYVSSTKAAGEMKSIDPSSQLATALSDSVTALRNKQQRPENRGWTHWGGFVADEGYAYMGYYNQEYDPATGLFRYHLASGDPASLDFALEMARQYADNSVGLSGGIYQHRSTSRALVGVVGEAVGTALTTMWREGQGSPASDAQMKTRTMTVYSGDGVVNSAVRNFLDGQLAVLTAQGVKDQARRERAAAWALGYRMSDSAMAEYEKDPTAIMNRLAPLNSSGADPAALNYARVHRAASVLVPLEPWMSVAVDDPSGVDTLYGPFFARYGGTWQEFPRLHFYDIPDIEENHVGSHTLVEMLVWAYLLTGDTHAQRSALRVARDFAAPGGMMDRATAAIVGMNHDGQPVHIRTGGWTLINVLALRLITQKLDEGLDGILVKKMQDLVKALLTVDPLQYTGVVHAGVVTEAFARFHFAYQESLPTLADQALQRLVEVATYWAKNQWSDGDNRFYYRLDTPDTVLNSGSFLMIHGMSYAASHSGASDTTSLLKSRIDALLGDASAAATTSKSFGMKFRNSLR